MNAGHAALGTGDMQVTMCQVHLLPPERAKLRSPQPMTEGQENHGRIAVAIAVVASGLHEPLDLALGQVLTLSIVRIRQPSPANCSLYSGRSLGVRHRIHWDNFPVLIYSVLITDFLRIVC